MTRQRRLLFLQVMTLVGALLAGCARTQNGSSAAQEAGAAMRAGQADTRHAEASASGLQAAARQPGPAAAVAGPNVVTYVARDFAFEGPERIPAGLTTIRMVNRGREPHQVMIVKLNDGKTVADLLKAMEAAGPEGQLPSWAEAEGGPNAAAPGEESNATAVLEPGRYAFVCVIPSPDGIPHLAKGMTEAVQVVPSGQAPGREPAADLTIKLVDYNFQLSAPLEAGTHTVRVENDGSEWHEIVVWQLAPGKSVSDLVAWAHAGMKTEPPAKPVGGIAPLKEGRHEFFTVDFRPGQYAFLCFLPDDEDGRPHIAHGMAKQLAVR